MTVPFGSFLPFESSPSVKVDVMSSQTTRRLRAVQGLL